MPRDISTQAVSLLASNYLRLSIFAELHFVSSVEYVWTGRGPIDWNGHTWQGLGDLGTISTISEDSTLTAQEVTLSLTGVRADLGGEALTEIQHGLPAKIFLVFFDASGTPIDSILSYAARMDQPTLDEGTEAATITISTETKLSDLQRAPFRRLTDQDQRLRFPTDDGFKFVPYLQDWNGSWGSK